MLKQELLDFAKQDSRYKNAIKESIEQQIDGLKKAIGEDQQELQFTESKGWNDYAEILRNSISRKEVWIGELKDDISALEGVQNK